VASEISSVLEPIPEEEFFVDVDGAAVYTKKLEQMRNANAAARRVFFRRKYRIKTLATFLSLG
jgi:hypothetical protein